MLDLIPISNILVDITGEISQTDNLNAYTRLFLLSKQNQVAKVCYKDYDLWIKNLHNLLLICNQITTRELPELVLPTSLIEYEGKIVGYLMPYIEGETLDKILLEHTIPTKKVLELFDKVAAIICRLPNNIHIGDLHSKNIVVSNDGNVFLIDVDGFSVDNGCTLTCPLNYSCSYYDNIPKNKYFNQDQTVKISQNTDIFCLLELFFVWLLNGFNPLRFSKMRFSLFLEYLIVKGIPKQVIDMIDRISKNEDNFLICSPFSYFDALLDDISYEDYLMVMELQEQEKQYISYINNIIEENENG